MRLRQKLLDWWGQPDHYEWLWAYLEPDNRRSPVRNLLVVASTSLCIEGPWTGALPVNLSQPPQDAFNGILIAAAIAFTFMWATRVLTRAQSIAFAATFQLAAAATAVLQTDPVLGIFACISFVCAASYIALAHSTRVMLTNSVFTTAIMTTVAIRLTLAGKPQLAAAASWLFLAVCVLVPICAQIAVHRLGIGAINAENDPLTGLLNRRGFAAKSREMLAGRRADDRDLAAIAIDLDRFKALNDTYGHAHGDHALIAVASTLRTNTRDTAIVARSGGEEFIIVDAIAPEPLAAVARRLCDAIGALPFPITASVGTAAHTLDEFDPDPQSSLEALVVAADHAMYAAKRAGGNQIRYTDLDTAHR
ncbi:GGDEF domain-containing protein [Mycobacterium sp. CBMA226]|nr:GGDEF domain-containing protein [Mycolicibacterium sp. CBMA 226]